jgi:WD repeat-containing protein 61
VAELQKFKPTSKTLKITDTRVALFFSAFTAMKLAGLKSIENAHDESVWAATWVPATETRPALLMTGALDETVKLWSSDELILERTNTGHSLGVASVAAHPSGHIGASASLDSFVRVFDVDTNATIATLEAPPSEVWQLRFSPEVVLPF